MNSERYLTVAAVAELLSCSKSTVWRRCADGTLPKPRKFGPSTRWLNSEINEYFFEVKSDRPAYYAGTPMDIALQRHFSFSDRIRYFWQEAPVRDAVDLLLNNLVAADVPNGLVTQAFGGLEFDETSGDIRTLLDTHVSKAVSRYYAACGFAGRHGLRPHSRA